ncbi:hypothetical protein ACQY0O_006842 [Thecaphora frezii]
MDVISSLFENAGGSQVLSGVVLRLSSCLLTNNVQMSSYSLAQKAARRVEDGKRAAALLLNAERVGDVLVGSSSTQLAETMARMLEAKVEKRDGQGLFQQGDEVVVSQADHEANIGAWTRLAQRHNLTVKVWAVTPLPSNLGGGQAGSRYSMGLDHSTLLPLLGPRTRLVAFTACFNVLGAFHDLPTPVSSIRTATAGRALVCVDCVAYAHHRRLAVAEWGVDLAFFSLYKTFGPHLGIGFVSSRARVYMEKLNHFFLHGQDEAGMFPYAPSSVQYELVDSVVAVAEYLVGLSSSAASEERGEIEWDRLSLPPPPPPFPTSLTNPELEQTRTQLASAFDRIAAHEQALLDHLAPFLKSRYDKGLRIVGGKRADTDVRAPTVAFVAVNEQERSRSVAAEIQRRITSEFKLGTQQGHMYAYRFVEALDLDPDDGVVRVSFVHYNTVNEVRRVCIALDRVLDGVL